MGQGRGTDGTNTRMVKGLEEQRQKPMFESPLSPVFAAVSGL